MVALVLLEIGLLGAVGLLVTASRTLSRAIVLERGAAEAAAVADSLSRHGVTGRGEVDRDGWRVVWGPAAGGSLEVSAHPPAGEDAPPSAVLFLP